MQYVHIMLVCNTWVVVWRHCANYVMFVGENSRVFVDLSTDFRNVSALVSVRV